MLLFATNPISYNCFLNNQKNTDVHNVSMLSDESRMKRYMTLLNQYMIYDNI